MKEITIEKYGSNNSFKEMLDGKISDLNNYIKILLNYIDLLESEHDHLKRVNSRLYAENSTLRKTFKLKEEKESKDNIYEKLEELRSQRSKWEKEILEKCMRCDDDLK